MSEVNRRWRPWIVLGLILVVAAGVRVWRLGDLPSGMFRDEAEKALNGWFLLNEGVDESGRPWPVFIKVFGVTTSAIYQFATVPFLGLGGLNEWTARLPAAMAGVLTVLFAGLFCRRVWGWQTALWAAGLLAVSPWHVPLSRWAQQGVFLPLFFAVAAWGLACFLDRRDDGAQADDGGNRRFQRRDLWLMLTAVCLALAMYTYDPARLFAPLLALVAAVIWWRVWVSRPAVVAAALLVFIVAVSPVIWLLINHGDEAQARFRFLSIVNEAEGVGGVVAAFLGNYFSHFTVGYLLISGDEELRHSGGVGMLNIVEFVFAMVGVVYAIRRRCRWAFFVVGWVLLSPVAASLTREGVPHALRSQVALPAWQVLAAVGIVATVQRVSAARRVAAQQWIFLGTLLGALPFFVSYFGSYAQRSAVNWQHGVKQSLEYLNNPATEDSHVIFYYVTGSDYLVPFYLQMDRREFMEMKRGAGRYESQPAMRESVLPIEQQPRTPTSGPIAWVMLPGLPPPPDTFAVPIRPAGANEQTPPSLLIYLNQELLERVKEQLTD